jgi:DNA polymerase-1
MLGQILLVDGMYLAFSSFYAYKNMKTLKGEPTGALFGFISRIEGLLKELHPDSLVVAFDSEARTFRHEMYADYKAKRMAPPEDLLKQLPYIRDYLDMRGIPRLQYPGIEADDIIARVSRVQKEQGNRVIIFTADKDMFQLVNDSVLIYHPKLKETLDPVGIKEHFGVFPHEIVDYLTLVGDSSDNIPGVPGIGDKTAKKLLEKYNRLDDLLNHLDEVDEKTRQKIRDNLETMNLSRKLVDLNNVPDFDLPFVAEKFIDRSSDDLAAFYRRFAFTSLLKNLAGNGTGQRGDPGIDYRVIATRAGLTTLKEKIIAARGFSFDVETTDLEFFKSRLVGISISFPTGGFYVPFLFPDREAGDISVTFADFKAELADLFADEAIKKTGHNLKFDILHLEAAGIPVHGLNDDSMIMSYLLNANRRTHNLKDLTLYYLDYKQVEYADLVGKGKDKTALDQLNVEKVGRYCIDDSYLSLKLAALLGQELEQKSLTPLYREIEMPLLRVLADMELTGVRIDGAFLAQASRQMTEKLREIEAEIIQAAGYTFNLNSPQQLAEFLFEKMNLPLQKKTRKTKSLSTDFEVLNELKGFPVVEKIIAYRTFKKLSSTYLEGLMSSVDDNSRVHTSYNQTVTATGRLSSSGPNLQNIPVGEMGGVNVRRAFVAEPGKRLLAADYSQVELRVMAHFSQDKELIDAFSRDFDIHQHTADTVFGKDLYLTDQERRRRAKIVNFSILYGSGPFSLSKELGVSYTEAKNFIDTYFEKHKGVKAFIDETILRAEAEPAVKTITGRLREIPEITSENKAIKENGKRMAINSIIQGSAADIIKIAMINIHRQLQHMGGTLIMQVHDELVLEYPPAEEEKLLQIVKQEMENASALKVPLKVVLKTGQNWGELSEIRF